MMGIPTKLTLSPSLIVLSPLSVLVCRYHAALTRYLSGEEERQSPGEAREVSARSVPSAASHKQVWEGLEDIGTIRTRDIKEKGSRMAVAPTNKDVNTMHHDDLVPAGLGSPPDFIVEPHYTRGKYLEPRCWPVCDVASLDCCSW